MMPEIETGCKIPIVIGVAGHRDLRKEDIPHLESAVGNIFKELKDMFPDTPLLVISSLAEGADQLVARVALDEFNAKVIVPLPMPTEEYQKDFSDSESVKEFNDLLDRAQHFTVPPVQGNTLEEIKSNSHQRNLQYTQSGAFIVRNCQVLIALWDGVKNDKAGGTAQIVQFATSGIPAPYEEPGGPLDIFEARYIYHVVTPRKSHENPVEKPYTVIAPYTGESDDITKFQKKFQQTNEHLNLYNRDIKKHIPFLGQKFEENKGYVIPKEDESQLPGQHKIILNFYAASDTLAIFYRDKNTISVKTIFILAVIAVLGFEVYAHLLKKPWVLATYPAALLAAFSVYYYAGFVQNVQTKYLDYRALAEGLRVQIYWRISGLKDEVTDHYLRKQQSELNWIHNAIHTSNLIAEYSCDVDRSKSFLKNSKEKMEYVLKRWIQDQAIFFNRNTKRDAQNINRHENITKILFVFGFILSLLVCLGDIVYHFGEDNEHLHHWLIVIMGFLPAVAAAFGGYAEKMAFSAQAKRYEWARDIFNIAVNRLNKLIEKNDMDSAQKLIRELGKEALAENGDWVTLHRERPIEPPKGG